MHTLSRTVQTRSLIILLAAAVFPALAAGFPLLAESFEVIVVKNADYKPYSDVLRGFSDACTCEAREMKLREDEGGEKVLQESPGAIVAIGTTVFKRIRTIKGLPVVYTMVMPSETAGSLSPNISGVSMDISPQVYIAKMRELFPNAKRIGLFYDPWYTAAFVGEAAKAAVAAGVELVERRVRGPREIPGLLDGMGALDFLWMVPDPTVVTAEAVEYLLRFSFQRNVPVFSFSKKYVEMGAVASLDVDPYDMGVQAGELVNLLAAGRTGPIRVYARASRLTINTKVAEKMGLAIKA